MRSKQELLVSLIAKRLEEAKVGILVKGISEISPDTVVRSVASRIGTQLFAAVIGYNITEASTNEVVISSRVENAVKWRSDPQLAGRIIGFVRTDSEKLHSLAEFDVITTRDLSYQLLDECLERPINTPTQDFWRALQETASHYSFETLYEYVVHVYADSDAAQAIPTHMWRLGLLCDHGILSTKANPRERLLKNRELIIAIGQLSEDHRKKLSRALVLADANERERLRKAYQDLQDFFKYGRRETLSRLDLATVQQLFAAAKSPKPKRNKKEGGPPKETPIRSKELEDTIADLVISPDEEDKEVLHELLSELRKHFDDTVQDNKDTIPAVGGEFSHRPIVLDNHRTPLRKLVGMACSEDVWGGIIATDKVILRDVISSDIVSFAPFSPNAVDSRTSFDNSSLFSFMRRFDDQFHQKKLDSAELFGPIIDRLVTCRSELVRSIDLIMFYPVLSFGVDNGLRSSLVGYITAWTDLLRAYCRNETIMHGISQKGSNFVARAILLLDVVYVQTPSEWKGVLMPLHPLYLWRYYEVFKELESKRSQMSEEEADSLAQVLSNLPQMLNFLIVDKMVTNSINVELPCSGTIEMLPTFENKTNRYLGYDGIEAIEEILARWLAFAPYTRNEVRICTVDAPDTTHVLRSLRSFIESGGCTRIVYDVYFTRDQNGNTELAKLDYDGADYMIGELIKSRRLSISIKNVASVSEVKRELHTKPVHVAFYFDQSAYSIEYGPSTKSLYISPLVITYDYEFDDITHRGEIFPSSDMDSGMIGDYHKMMRFADVVTANRTPRPTYNPDADISGVTSTLADGEVTWLVAADRSTNNYMPDHAITIGEKRYGQRVVTMWASRDSRIIEQYMRILRRYNLYPDRDVLIDVLSQFGHISREGLISIPRSGADSGAIENRIKGLIGTVFAAAWYSKNSPNSLVASLDSRDARLWLNNTSHGNERADLIGLRYSEATNTLHLQPIEVKTRDDSPEAVISTSKESAAKLITGHAADQIASVVAMLKEIFGLVQKDSLDMFVSARREVLKYHIVSECFRNVHDAEWQKQWSQILKRAFGSEKDGSIKVDVSGLLIHVQLSEASGGATIQAVHPDHDDCPIELVKLTSKEIQAEILGNKAPAKQTWSKVDFDETEETEDCTEIDFEDQGEREQEHREGTVGDADTSVDCSHSRDVEDGNDRGGTHPKSQLLTSTLGEVFMSESHGTSRALNECGVKHEEIEQLARDFIRSCKDYRIHLKECDPTRAVVGPNVIRFYFKLARGQELSGLKSHLEDIGREMRRTGVLVQTVQNSDELILDVPRLQRDQVLYSDVLERLPHVSSPERLFFPLGRTPDGRDIIKDLSEMPHLLVGGSTGSGKTVFLFTLLATLLKTHPTAKDLQLVLSSSGLEDFVHFEGIPHLVNGHVISDAAEATEVIKGLVFSEFERREKILADARVANISQYNAKFDEKLAPLVVVIDEFADLADQLEKKKDKDAFFTPVKRIAQIGRKRGIHLVVCTQRPAADLVPSNIKAQLNGRLALRVNDANSSRMILEEMGAQHLQKHGDMIYKNGGEVERVQGYYLSVDELDEIIQSVRNES